MQELYEREPEIESPDFTTNNNHDGTSNNEGVSGENRPGSGGGNSRIVRSSDHIVNMRARLQ